MMACLSLNSRFKSKPPNNSDNNLLACGEPLLSTSCMNSACSLPPAMKTILELRILCFKKIAGEIYWHWSLISYVLNHDRLSTAALKVKIEGPNFRKRMTITTIKTNVSFDILMPPTDYNFWCLFCGTFRLNNQWWWYLRRRIEKFMDAILQCSIWWEKVRCYDNFLIFFCLMRKKMDARFSTCLLSLCFKIRKIVQ